MSVVDTVVCMSAVDTVVCMSVVVTFVFMSAVDTAVCMSVVVTIVFVELLVVDLVDVTDWLVGENLGCCCLLYINTIFTVNKVIIVIRLIPPTKIKAVSFPADGLSVGEFNKRSSGKPIPGII